MGFIAELLDFYTENPSADYWSFKNAADVPAIKKHYDCANPKSLPKTDWTVFAGVAPFLFHDEQLHKLFSRVKSSMIYIKAPCSLDKPTLVNTFSKKLNAPYSSYYRTPEPMTEIIRQHFSILEITRAYPDEIESEFGTKQFIFLCQK
jgi:hypothetical protein